MFNPVRPSVNKKIGRLSAMTVCVAALCEKQKALALVSDKMFSMGELAQTELKIEKITPLCKDWHVMIAGNDISPAFDIINYTRENLADKTLFSVNKVITEVEKAYKRKREEESEAIILNPIGFTLKTFASDGGLRLNPVIYERLQDKLSKYELQIQLIVAGFDENGIGHIFSLEHPGIHRLWDIPGFYAIGSGNLAAIQMMLSREPNVDMKIFQILYYAFEAKIFSEKSPGVGVESDIYILMQGYKKKITQRTEKNLESIWEEVHPSVLIPNPLILFPECKKLLELLNEEKSKKRKRKKR